MERCRAVVGNNFLNPRIMGSTGTVESKEKCKVMVLGCGLECATTEAKGTVLLHNAEDLKNFTKGEEAQMEEIIRGIKNAGVLTLTISSSFAWHARVESS